jgi:hypothetical protein
MADLKDPTTAGALLAVCVYDGAGGSVVSSVVPAGESCGRRGCWKAIAGGYVYRNDAATADGVAGVRLKAGAGGLRVAVDGRGGNLAMPTVGLDLPVTVQLVVTDGTDTACWVTRFTSAQHRDAASFRATSP